MPVSVLRAPAVYIVRDAEQRPLYVGSSSAVCSRLYEHFRTKALSPTTPRGDFDDIAAEIEILSFQHINEARAAERELIESYRPPFNSNFNPDVPHGSRERIRRRGDSADHVFDPPPSDGERFLDWLLEDAA